MAESLEVADVREKFDRWSASVDDPPADEMRIAAEQDKDLAISGVTSTKAFVNPPPAGRAVPESSGGGSESRRPSRPQP
jgi:hypothetical protein